MKSMKANAMSDGDHRSGPTYRDLGSFSGIVQRAKATGPLYPIAAPGEATRQAVKEVLGFASDNEAPVAPETSRTWTNDGVFGQEVSWSVGYGPRTMAWLLRPAGVDGPLPGVLALHDHGAYKRLGKEKIADGPEAPVPSVVAHRKRAYEGVAYANELAKRGYNVLVHDTFLWGSRRFPLDLMDDRLLTLAGCGKAEYLADEQDEETASYNAAAELHENLVEKYCTLLGTSFAGVVCYEDRVALNFLRSWPDVDSNNIACIGLSGGGNRASMLSATHDGLSASVILGMMTTYEGLLDAHVKAHTWMLYPPGWARHGDWPDVAAANAPRPLLVQYDREDPLFSLRGMEDADARLKEHYRLVGRPENYVGEFYPGPHKFDLEMQASAFGWIDDQLHGTR